MAGQRGLSGWLHGLMEETFFDDCETHVAKKNIFCLYCCISICENCVPAHQSHRRIQVRRRQASALVKLDDLKELIDCSLVRLFNYQTYGTKKEKLMFLRPQPRVKVSNIKRNNCSFCGNMNHYDYPYCSLTCKVEHVRLQGNDISSLLFQFDASQITSTESENLRISGYDLSDSEVFDSDHNHITPDLDPIEFVQLEGSSSGWSLSDIVESCKKKK